MKRILVLSMVLLLGLIAVPKTIGHAGEPLQTAPSLVTVLTPFGPVQTVTPQYPVAIARAVPIPSDQNYTCGLPINLDVCGLVNDMALATTANPPITTPVGQWAAAELTKWHWAYLTSGSTPSITPVP